MDSEDTRGEHGGSPTGGAHFVPTSTIDRPLPHHMTTAQFCNGKIVRGQHQSVCNEKAPYVVSYYADQSDAQQACRHHLTQVIDVVLAAARKPAYGVVSVVRLHPKQ